LHETDELLLLSIVLDELDSKMEEELSAELLLSAEDEEPTLEELRELFENNSSISGYF
jgi:hypothetical protein